MRLTTPNFPPLLLHTFLLLLILTTIPTVSATLPETAPKLAQDLQTWANKISTWTNTSTPIPCKVFVHAFIGPGKRVGITSNWITKTATSSPDLNREQSSRAVVKGMIPVSLNQVGFETRVLQKVGLIKSCPGALEEARELVGQAAEAIAKTFEAVGGKMYGMDKLWVSLVGDDVAKRFQSALQGLN